MFGALLRYFYMSTLIEVRSLFLLAVLSWTLTHCSIALAEPPPLDDFPPEALFNPSDSADKAGAENPAPTRKKKNKPPKPAPEIPAEEAQPTKENKPLATKQQVEQPLPTHSGLRNHPNRTGFLLGMGLNLFQSEPVNSQRQTLALTESFRYFFELNHRRRHFGLRLEFEHSFTPQQELVLGSGGSQFYRMQMVGGTALAEARLPIGDSADPQVTFFLAGGLAAANLAFGQSGASGTSTDRTEIYSLGIAPGVHFKILPAICLNAEYLFSAASFGSLAPGTGSESFSLSRLRISSEVRILKAEKTTLSIIDEFGIGARLTSWRFAASGTGTTETPMQFDGYAWVRL